MAGCTSSAFLEQALLFLTLLVLTFPARGVAIECFVCSYAPRSNTTRLDVCSESNFTENVINTRSCNFGCERVASYDVNGELESYHRNCAYQETPLTNTCETYDTVILTKIVCACDYSYCNSSPRSSLHSGLCIATTVTLLCVWYAVHRRCHTFGTLSARGRSSASTLIPT